MLAQVVANQTWRSYEPIQITREEHTLQYVMENIVADFQYLKKNSATPLEILKTNVAEGRYWDNNTLKNGVAVNAYTIVSCFVKTSPGTFNEIESASCPSPNIPILKVVIGITGSQHQMEAFFMD